MEHSVTGHESDYRPNPALMQAQSSKKFLLFSTDRPPYKPRNFLVVSAAPYGWVTRTRKYLAEPLIPAVSRMVTLSLGDPLREVSIACAVNTMLVPA